MLEENREFIASKACDRVAWTEAVRYFLADGDEELISDSMAEAVVDHLETVHVKEKYGVQVSRVSLRASEDMVKTIHEKRTVGETG